MPDLKSELQKLESIKFDDDGEAQDTAPEASLGLSNKLFNIVRDNPASTRQQLINMADTAGIAKGSSSSLLTQFVKRGLLRTANTDGVTRYFAGRDSYVSGYLTGYEQRKVPTRIAAPKASSPAAPQDITVQEMLNTLSIVKARMLYDELKKIFGG